MEGADDGLAGGTCQAPLNHESEKRPREEAIDGATQGLSNGPAQKKTHQSEQWHDEVQALANHVLQASSLSNQPWPCVTVVTYVFFSGHK